MIPLRLKKQAGLNNLVIMHSCRYVKENKASRAKTHMHLANCTLKQNVGVVQKVDDVHTLDWSEMWDYIDHPLFKKKTQKTYYSNAFFSESVLLNTDVKCSLCIKNSVLFEYIEN